MTILYLIGYVQKKPSESDRIEIQGETLDFSRMKVDGFNSVEAKKTI